MTAVPVQYHDLWGCEPPRHITLVQLSKLTMHLDQVMSMWHIAIEQNCYVVFVDTTRDKSSTYEFSCGRSILSVQLNPSM